MMTSFYNLLKYAATGIASPDMTYYDKLRASTLMGGSLHTLTGQPPLTFKADGTPLISWSMKGNGSQHGTPTPDNPVMPTFCGVRTVNMFSVPNVSATVGAVTVTNTNGRITVIGTTNVEISSTNTAWKNAFSFVLKAGTYYVSGSASGGVSSYIRKASDDSRISLPNDSFTLSEDTLCYIGFYLYRNTNNDFNIMLNLGTTALPYEPFGYKIPISCGGETTLIYLGQVSTVRKIKKLVLDGTESITLQSVNQYGVANFAVPNTDAPNRNTVTRIILCSHYEQQNAAISNTMNTGIYNGSSVFIRDTSNTTVDDIKAFLAAQYAAGTPVVIWYVLANEETAVVNEPLCKIGTYADELHSEDAAVTIPTVKGQNVLTVDTELQPSEMTITYKG